MSNVHGFGDPDLLQFINPGDGDNIGDSDDPDGLGGGDEASSLDDIPTSLRWLRSIRHRAGTASTMGFVYQGQHTQRLFQSPRYIQLFEGSAVDCAGIVTTADQSGVPLPDLGTWSLADRLAWFEKAVKDGAISRKDVVFVDDKSAAAGTLANIKYDSPVGLFWIQFSTAQANTCSFFHISFPGTGMSALVPTVLMFGAYYGVYLLDSQVSHSGMAVIRAKISILRFQRSLPLWLSKTVSQQKRGIGCSLQSKTTMFTPSPAPLLDSIRRNLSRIRVLSRRSTSAQETWLELLVRATTFSRPALMPARVPNAMA